jgi:hypothetical protein
MGYRRTRKVYVLDFADTDLDGLEVKARSVSLGDGLEFDSLLQAIADIAQREDATLADQKQAVRDLAEAFAAVLVDWNLEGDDGNPVPPSADALYGLEQGDLQLLVRAWRMAASGVPGPLEPPSNAGERSAEESIPMEPLSPSPANWHVPA